MNTKRSEGLKYITRFEYGGQRAWWVRIQRHTNGTKEVISKYFADGAPTLAARLGALQAAKKWRDVQLAILPGRTHAKRRTPVGHFYVRRRTQWRSGGDGWDYAFEAWEGFIKVGMAAGEHKLTRWSIDKWGNDDAFRRCWAWIAQQRLELARAGLIELDEVGQPATTSVAFVHAPASSERKKRPTVRVLTARPLRSETSQGRRSARG